MTKQIEDTQTPQPALLAYDNSGQLIGVTQCGKTKRLVYVGGRLHQVISSTSTTTLNYDKAGNLTSTKITNA